MAVACMCISTLFCWFLWPMFVDSKLAKIDICLILFCSGTLMQARACECVMGGSLDTMCQTTIAFVSKNWPHGHLDKNFVQIWAIWPKTWSISGIWFFVNSNFSKNSQFEISWKLTWVHVVYFGPPMTRFQDQKCPNVSLTGPCLMSSHGHKNCLAMSFRWTKAWCGEWCLICLMTSWSAR